MEDDPSSSVQPNTGRGRSRAASEVELPTGFDLAAGGARRGGFDLTAGSAGLTGEDRSILPTSRGPGVSRAANARERPTGFGLASSGTRHGGSGLASGAMQLNSFGFTSDGSSSMTSAGERFCSTGQPSSGGWLSGFGPTSSDNLPGGSFPAYAGLGAYHGGGGLASTGMWPGGPGFTEFMTAAGAGRGASSYPSDVNASGFFPGTFATLANIDNGPSQASSARSGGGRRRAASALGDVDSEPAQGKAKKRRGKRAEKAPASADTSEDILDLTEGSCVADWCEENLRIFCEICADEVRIGNRANTHLNKTGYKNLIKRFQERTCILYTRMQFKNRWDKSKADYGIWKALLKETGLGWKKGTRNIDMTAGWWTRTDEKIKGCIKFQDQGLQNEEFATCNIRRPSEQWRGPLESLQWAATISGGFYQ